MGKGAETSDGVLFRKIVCDDNDIPWLFVCGHEAFDDGIGCLALCGKKDLNAGLVEGGLGFFTLAVENDCDFIFAGVL